MWSERLPLVQPCPGFVQVLPDWFLADKRMLVFESEFASPVRMMAREGNILSVVIRQAWDTGVLLALTKNSPAITTGGHISIVGHMMRDELRRELSATDMPNGFANRFLWVCTSRSIIRRFNNLSSLFVSRKL
jgi:hypothetical protein